MTIETKDRLVKALLEWKAFTREIAGFAIFGGFFATLWLLLKSEIPPTNKDVLLILLGVLASSFKDVVGFLWGGSFGSEKKTDIAANKTEGQ